MTSVGDAAALLPLGGGLVLAVILLIRTWPAFSLSLLKQARDEVNDLHQDLDECRAARRTAEAELRDEQNRAHRYQMQILQLGGVPYDKGSVDS